MIRILLIFFSAIRSPPTLRLHSLLVADASDGLLSWQFVVRMKGESEKKTRKASPAGQKESYAFGDRLLDSCPAVT